MILFGKMDRAGVKSGKITVAFRDWETPRVSPGKTYRSHDLGLLFIEQAEKIPISSISERDAQAAGARSLKNLLNSYMRRHPNCNPRVDECVRIQFHYLGDDEEHSRKANDTHLSRSELEEIGGEIQAMDKRAKGNGSAVEILGLLARQEWTTSREIAEVVNLNPDQIKRRMALLKRDGVVESSSQLGYRLTPRGMRYYTFEMTGK